MTAAAIEVRGLTRSYRGGGLANDHIDLTLQRGQAMSVLGPNGAGKTTLIRQITGELTPTSGSIAVLGYDMIREPLKAKAVMGVVPQDAAAFPHLKPGEQLHAFGRLHGLGRREAASRTEELMASLGLEPYRDRLNKELSGGLRRKVLIATAMIAKPPILVLDEPTTGLDPHSRREVWAMLRSLRRDGASLLITTHYMDEAEALSDTVTVIGSGQVLARGSVEQLREMCTSRFKAAYVQDDEQRTVYAATQAELIETLEREGIEEFSLARTSLEDLYLELTGS